MKNTLLFTTLIAGIALTGCNKSTRTSTADTSVPPSSTDTTTTTSSATDSLNRAGDRMADATRNAANDVSAATRDAADRAGTMARDAASSMRQAGQDLSAKMSEWRLNASDIEADVMADRPIVRTKSDAGAPTGKIDEDTLESAIKGKLHSDAKIADLRFDVNANEKGEVELEGKARTADQIAHAMAVALSTENVTKVTSKIDLDPDAGR